MATTFSYKRNAERPSAEVWWYDDAGDLRDFSVGVVSWHFKIGEPGETALLTKTSGIAGAAGSGVAPDGVPNVVITWAPGELDIEPGTYTWELWPTLTGPLDLDAQTGLFVIEDTIA